MTSIAFQRVNTHNHECYICKVESTSPFIAHLINNQHELGHHVHEKCLKIWARTRKNYKCQVCQKTFDKKSIFPIRKRTLRKDTCDALQEGLNIAALMLGFVAIGFGACLVSRKHRSLPLFDNETGDALRTSVLSIAGLCTLLFFLSLHNRRRNPHLF